jgi:hypothetical protein
MAPAHHSAVTDEWGKSVNVLLEATPEGVVLEEVRRHILETKGVAGCHDLHAWTITSGMNVVAVHVVLDDGADSARVLARLGDCLSDHFDIEHSTFQLEPARCDFPVPGFPTRSTFSRRSMNSPPGQLGDERLVHRGTGGEVEGLQGLE